MVTHHAFVLTSPFINLEGIAVSRQRCISDVTQMASELGCISDLDAVEASLWGHALVGDYAINQ